MEGDNFNVLMENLQVLLRKEESNVFSREQSLDRINLATLNECLDKPRSWFLKSIES